MREEEDQLSICSKFEIICAVGGNFPDEPNLKLSTWIRCQADLSGICGQSGTTTGLCPEYFGVDDVYLSLRVIKIGGSCGTHEKEEKWVQSVGGGKCERVITW